MGSFRPPRQHDGACHKLPPLGFMLLLVLVCVDPPALLTRAEALELPHPRQPGDLIEYRASARLLLNGQNPHSAEQMLSLQRTIEPERVQPLLTWNPPWTLFFTAPLGLLNIATRIPWLLLWNHADVFGSEFKANNSLAAPGHCRILVLLPPRTVVYRRAESDLGEHQASPRSRPITFGYFGWYLYIYWPTCVSKDRAVFPKGL